jgi:hypothetical protein
MMALIVFTTLPTFAFTPIGIIPAVVLTITFTVSWFVHRLPQAVEREQRNTPLQESQPIEEMASL